MKGENEKREEQQEDQKNKTIKHHAIALMYSREPMNTCNCLYQSSRRKGRERNQLSEITEPSLCLQHVLWNH